MSILNKIFGTREAAPINRKMGRQKANPDRDMQITLAYQDGQNSQRLADKYGVTRERICQILRRTNTIEHRAERRRIEKETIENEATELRTKAKAEFDQRLAAAIELVRSGSPLNKASRQVGLPPKSNSYLGLECKKAGVSTVYGPWRDYGPKIVRVRELRGEGHTWADISSICISEGLGPVVGAWPHNNVPDLMTKRIKREKKETPTIAKPPKPPEFEWSEENTNKLVQLWLNGASAQQCVDVLGPPITRNSIIGKINRLRAAGKLNHQPGI